LKAVQPVDVITDSFGSRIRPVRKRHDRPLVSLKLTERQAVDLPFGYDDTFAASFPETLTEHLDCLGLTDPTELFAFHADVLGNQMTVMVVVRSDLTGDTTVLRDAVAEQLTGLLGYPTLGERAIR
jgi:hypothetical protein